jgi:DsbC/DsbD-like thiol-disulfide interchange protein
MYKGSSTAAGGTEVASKLQVSTSSAQSTVWNNPGHVVIPPQRHCWQVLQVVKSRSALDLICFCGLQALLI